MTRYTYARLLELVEGDRELIAALVEHGLIETRDEDRALVNVEQVLVARTLWRDLEIDWPGIEVILRLLDDLAGARRRITELERAVSERADS
ncbi:MAG TPA: chaperone modulator CbpM [Kofleriaceae bacterium]|nr:chaperone modulator CbpM [Kofleriaceae bacterium]